MSSLGKTRRFSDKEKLRILKEGCQNGIILGCAGIGPWQQEELAAFLSEFHRRKCPVIPTLLPDAPAKPGLARLSQLRASVPDMGSN
jgi:hypothetical protein